MKLMAAAALACGFLAAPVLAATGASADPSSCDGAGCVPYVMPNVVKGAHCLLATRYVFGFNSAGGTMICTGKNEWAPSAPLIGVRTDRQPCNDAVDKGVAQSPDGIPLTCHSGGWSQDYTAIYFPGGTGQYPTTAPAG